MIISVLIVLVVATFITRRVISIKDTQYIQQQMLSIASESHWNILNSGKVLGVEFTALNKAWGDSVEFLIVLSDQSEANTLNIPKMYNSNNSMIFASQVVANNIANNERVRNWTIITDTTKMLDFLLSADTPVTAFNIKRGINSQFELRKRDL